MATQYFQCPRCRATNAAGSRFCSSCGLAFSQPPPPFSQPNFQSPNIPPKKKSGMLALWLVLGCIGLCALCGGLGAILDKTKKDETAASNSTQLTGATNQAVTNIPAATPTPPPTFADLKARAETLLKFSKDEYVKEDLNQFDEVMTPLNSIPKEDKNYKEAQTLHKKLIDKTAPIMAEIVILGPKPENSAYDGSVRPAENYLKEALNDYHSSEYLGWTEVKKVYIGKEPYWGTKVKLRAKNAFGAFIVKDVYFLIRNNQVVKVEGL